MTLEHNPDFESNDPNEEESPVLLLEEDAALVLATGTMHEKGLLPYSSNHSFLVTVTARPPANGQTGAARQYPPDEITLPAVYKPQRGETPLWDFEWGSLCSRETAAYEISSLLGWQLVPPTVLRRGTRGLGSVQLFVDHNEEDHYFTVQADARYAPTFRRMALFDYVINNADRKSGHCLIGSDGRVWAIDHGVCLHEEYKLRTVIWEFGGIPIDKDLMEDLIRFRALLDDSAAGAIQRLCRLLTPAEQDAMKHRVDDLLRARRFPKPDPYRRNFPWPPI